MLIFNYFRRSFFFAAAFSAIAVGGCTSVTDTYNKMKSVVTNGKDDRVLSDADEVEMDKSVGLLVTNRYAPVDDRKLIEYVNLVGFTLVSASSAPDGQYLFAVLDTGDIASYSGPGGSVFITRGEIQSMHDEAELAGVLAHELSHAFNHHVMKSAIAAAQKEGYMNQETGVLVLPDADRFMDAGLDTAVRNGFDKLQETEADNGAVQLLIAAGYNPHSYANYLKRRAEKMNETGRTARQTTPATDLADRARQVEQQIAAAGVVGGATMQARFAEATAK